MTCRAPLRKTSGQGKQGTIRDLTSHVLADTPTQPFSRLHRNTLRATEIDRPWSLCCWVVQCALPQARPVFALPQKRLRPYGGQELRDSKI